ncbi:MAG: hypothetical protein WD688_20545, partial [Candidatus Binatia bacterium]
PVTDRGSVMPVKAGIQVNLISCENRSRHKIRMDPGCHRGDDKCGLSTVHSCPSLLSTAECTVEFFWFDL